PDAGGRGMDVEKLQQINRIYHAATQFQRIHGRLPGEPTPLHAAAPAAEARTARAVVATHAGAHHDARAGAMVPMAGPGRRLRFLLLAGVMAAAVAGLLELRGDASQGDAAEAPGAGSESRSVQPPVDAERRMALGMAPDEVLLLSGPPLSAHERRWDYGPSWVTFECGVVSDWYSSPLRPIHRGPARPEHRDATVRDRCRNTGKSMDQTAARASLIDRIRRRVWMRYTMRNGGRDDPRRFDMAYRIPDPWGMSAPGEQHRFEATSAIISREFGRVGSLLEVACGEGHQ